METESPESPLAARATQRRRWSALVLLATAGPVLYGVGLWAAARLDHQTPATADCFRAAAAGHFTGLRVSVAVVMMVGAVGTLLVAPWSLGTLAIKRIESRRATAGAWSLAVNSVTLVLLCLILRNTLGLSRGSFLGGWLVWTAALAVFAGQPQRCGREIRVFWQRYAFGLGVGLAASIAGIVLFRHELGIQCFNGDGVGAFELARSLRYRFLPYWEIETTRRFGTVIVNPVLVNSYWTCAMQLLLGKGEIATRLIVWIWWFGIFATAWRMVRDIGAATHWWKAVVLAGWMFLVAVWYTFSVGYYPYMVDPSNPGIPDAVFTLLMLLALDCLRQRDLIGWVLLMSLSCLVLYAGPIMFLLTVAAGLVWQPVSRRMLLGGALAGLLILAGMVAFYVVWGWLDRSLFEWPDTLRAEYFEEYFAPVPRSRSALLYLGYFALGCGGIPVISLLRVFSRRNASPEAAWDRTVATVTLAYLLIILASGVKNLHYLGPLLPIPVILWLKDLQGANRRRTPWAAALSAGLSLTVCLVLCWPTSRPLFTLNRRLGSMTTFETDSYEQACQWGHVIEDLYDRGWLGWQVGHHTWVAYSALEAQSRAPRPLLVTDRDAPPAPYELLYESEDGTALYCRDPQVAQWMAVQRPKTALKRWPWVFRPIAPRPRARLTESALP